MTAAFALLRRFWWAIPIVALAAGWLYDRARLADVRHTLTNERAAWTAEIARADAARLAAERDYAARLTTATASYADRLAARQPIILKSTNTVREYAATPAGRAVCLGADRVRGIDALDAELSDDPDPAGGRGGAVHPDPDAPPAGR